MFSDEEYMSNTIGLRPSSLWRWPEYVVTKFFVLKIKGRMHDQVLLRCEGCRKLISTRWPCKCGEVRCRRTNGNTWNAFWVWARRR